jgi:hypothetical protein
MANTDAADDRSTDHLNEVMGLTSSDEAGQIDREPTAETEPEEQPASNAAPEAVGIVRGAEAEGSPTTDPGRPQKDTPEVELSNLKAALTEERKRRQEQDAAVTEATRRATRMEDTFAQVMQRIGNQPPADGAAPDAPQTSSTIPEFEEDPAGHVLGSIGDVKQQLDTFIKSQQEQQETQTQEQQVLTRYRSDASQYMSAHPEFSPAYQYLLDHEKQAVAAMGYDAPAIEKIVGDYEMGIVVNAYQSGKNPAEVVMHLAHLRGFNPQQQQRMAPGGNGAQPGYAEQKLETIRRGQDASQSLGGTSGGDTGTTGPQKGTLEYLAALPPGPAFDDAWDAYRKNALGFGG